MFITICSHFYNLNRSPVPLVFKWRGLRAATPVPLQTPAECVASNAPPALASEHLAGARGGGHGRSHWMIQVDLGRSPMTSGKDGSLV
jgi:hypothetical protein